MELFSSRKKRAYSLIEMVVTLALTSVILLSLTTLLTTVLKISASNYARAKTREDLVNFVQEFEKDMRNSSKIGICQGNEGNFRCEVFTDAFYRWQACSRPTTQVCAQVGTATCDTKNATVTLCKYLLDSSGNQVREILRLDNLYNLERFNVTGVVANPPTGQPTTPNRIVAFTAVASHPNSTLNINNVVRQSIVSTRNFEPEL